MIRFYYRRYTFPALTVQGWVLHTRAGRRTATLNYQSSVRNGEAGMPSLL